MGVGEAKESTLYGGRGGKGQNKTEILLCVPTFLATIVGTPSVK